MAVFMRIHAHVRCMLVRRGVYSCALHAHVPCVSVCVWCGSSPRVRVMSVCSSCSSGVGGGGAVVTMV